MPRSCTICTHDQRHAIDQALIAGESYRDIARRYATSKDALTRHKADHLPVSIVKAKAVEEEANVDKLLRELAALKNKAVSLLLQAEESGDLRTALAGVREARGCLEVLLEFEGELDRRAQVNVLVANPEWLAVRTAILTALQEHPEARTAVVRALGRVDASAAA